jgi:rRNA maturation endonuclease Nob1
MSLNAILGVMSALGISLDDVLNDPMKHPWAFRSYCWECGKLHKRGKRVKKFRCRKCGARTCVGRAGWVNKFHGGVDPNLQSERRAAI